MLLRLLLCVHACTAVKEWMFRKCAQNPFCVRQTSYAADPTPGLWEFSGLDFSDLANITGRLTRRLSDAEKQSAIGAREDHVEFPFRLELISDEIYRFFVDEAVREMPADYATVLTAQRFSPAPWVLVDTYKQPAKAPTLEKRDNGFTLAYGAANTLDVQLRPPRLAFARAGVPMLTFNAAGALNIEHQRRRQRGDPQAWWSDRFDHHLEMHVRGPESVALDVTFDEFKHVYGIPEHADSFSLRDTVHGAAHEPYRLFNVDIFQYDVNSVMPMYGAIPLMLAQKPGAAAGVFWLNSADTYIDVDKRPAGIQTHWMSESGVLDVFAILGSTVRDIEATYGTLTGPAVLPPLFSLGYHQCRWNYMTQAEVLDVDSLMDYNKLPYDVIWLDIEWTDDRKYFAWNKNYPDPPQMLGQLASRGRELVVLNDPHIKVQPGYEAFDLVSECAVLDAQGSGPFKGHCWPGESIWVDGFHPNSTSTWTHLCRKGTSLGGDADNLHLWSDMSEPSVFSGSESTAYKDLVHYGGWQHRDVHNLYGHTIFNMTTEALKARYSDKQRPFVLTRSFFAGSQRVGPAWTGDNQAEWAYLESSIPTVLTLGLAGMPFVGADVGGFFKNPEDELLVRWYQTGAFYPFFREHAHEESAYREPYLLKDENLEAVRGALQLRYELLPEFYTLFYESSKTLSPVLRPLVYEFPEDENVYATDYEFMLGSKLLVAPITAKGITEILISLPEGPLWYEYFTGAPVLGSPLQAHVGISSLPLFVRGGEVVFKKERRRRSTRAMTRDPYTLIVALDRDGHARGYVYIDDGESYAHEQGAYLTFEIVKDDDGIAGHVLHATPGYDDLVIERIKVYGGDFASTPYARLETDDVEDSYLLRTQETEYGFDIVNPRLPVSSDWFVKLY